MKKRIAYLLAAAMLLGLTACGGGSTAAESSSAGSGGAEAAESTGAASSAESGEEGSANEGGESTPREITFQETAFIDNEYCSFTVTGLEPDAEEGYAVYVTIENKTADETLSCSCTEYVDGVQCTGYFGSSYASNIYVSAGETVNDVLFVKGYDSSTSLAETLGYSDFTDLEMTVSLNGDEYYTWTEETFHVYPYGEENAAAYTREGNGTDQVLLDNDSVRLTLTGVEETEYSSHRIFLYVENKMDQVGSFSADNIFINGCMVKDHCFIQDVNGQKSGFGEFYIDKETWAENSIEKLEDLAFTLTIETYHTDTGEPPTTVEYSVSAAIE